MPSFALAAAGAGALSAVFHATLLTGSFGALIFAYLAQLPLFLVGLWVGATGAAFAGLVAVAGLALAGGFTFAGAYFLINALPAVLMTVLAQLNRPSPEGGVEWLSAGALITALAGLGVAAFFAFYTLLLGEPGGAEGVLGRVIGDGVRAFIGNDVDADSLAAMATALARVFPGIVIASWLTMILANAVLAQGLLARFGRNFRPSPAMADIDLPGWLRGAFAIALAGAFMPGHAAFVGTNLAVILALAYALAGLGVMHALLRTSPHRGPLLGAAYAFMFVFGWPLIIAMLLGLAEPWLNLRRRAAGGPRT
ncbi:MAG TPA: DUF2232 domain-containing protein [Alphaproteobacteria bacterium]|nr:DUF2232 domain-containing protein [Alphaproteobacteria bacterium]